MQTDFIGGDQTTVLFCARRRPPPFHAQFQLAWLKNQKPLGATRPVRRRSRPSKGCRQISMSSRRAMLPRSFLCTGDEPLCSKEVESPHHSCGRKFERCRPQPQPVRNEPHAVSETNRPPG